MEHYAFGFIEIFHLLHINLSEDAYVDFQWQYIDLTEIAPS